MKRFTLALAFLLAVTFAPAFTSYAQHDSMGPHGAGGEKPAAIVPGLGEHSHRVSTASAEAQRFFDQGLNYVFAFNHDEAVRSFERAAELDPQLAMAHWGIALALGPNINLNVDPAREMLGAVLLRSRRAVEAEQVFRADLEKNPRSGRSLFGLMESLKAQGKRYAAQMVWKEFEAAWKNADTQLKVEDL